ncbi:MAG: lytic transglycosylase domain-containing protein [Gammaproteobacteria bacterium]|nr:lytic transglycosylase domain-containing protein [Gammaproteobacteria bacterium]NNF62100.1 lytic transglycosylase domain-containing protein [Gammaproteobacteria bacterium]NNM20484.1 lytic transglycosylase domain-containing protein [Gammaproteobacteria bacterium]
MTRWPVLAVLLLLPFKIAVASQQAWHDYASNDTQAAPALKFPHETCFRSAAIAHDVPFNLLLAVARGESDFNVRARSHANAHGLMQILWPTTARHLGIHQLSKLYEPCTNIDAGARYLREMLNRYDGNIHLALAAYNYGPHRINAGQRIPDGAAWYSAYIHRHLDYVLGRGPSALPPAAGADYDVEAKMALITFGAPYRAQAFVDQLQSAEPALRLEWFREEAGRFRVMLLYNGKADLRRAQSRLRNAGFRIRRRG